MWWSVVIAGVCAALATVIAELLARGSGRRGATYTLVVAIGFIVLNQAARVYILPEIRAWEAKREVEELFQENRLFSLLSARHPEMRDQLTTLVVDLVRRGASSEEATREGVALGRTLVSPYFQKYAPNASGDSLGHFVSVMVDTLDQLGTREDDACYFWMFGGQAPSGFSLSAAISQSELIRMLDAMADVIESSLSAPQDPPNPQEAEAALALLRSTLAEAHGDAFIESMSVLAQPRNPNVDRRLVCDVATKFYQGALRVPVSEQGVLLRSLFGAVDS